MDTTIKDIERIFERRTSPLRMGWRRRSSIWPVSISNAREAAIREDVTITVGTYDVENDDIKYFETIKEMREYTSSPSVENEADTTAGGEKEAIAKKSSISSKMGNLVRFSSSNFIKIMSFLMHYTHI
jgi:hypothetical protein